MIAACADREETWINAELEQAMIALHGSGHAHSIEVWQGETLAGGIFGVKLGRAFFGESMFNRVRDASKVALAWLVARMKVGNFTLLDCQFMTDHLASLGAVSITRETYVALLSAALGGGQCARPPEHWSMDWAERPKPRPILLRSTGCSKSPELSVLPARPDMSSGQLLGHTS